MLTLTFSPTNFNRSIWTFRSDEQITLTGGEKTSRQLSSELSHARAGDGHILDTQKAEKEDSRQKIAVNVRLKYLKLVVLGLNGTASNDCQSLKF